MADLQLFFSRARLFLAVSGGIFVLLIALLATPYFQSHALYLNAVRLPWFADFSVPERYGLAPNKTLNFHIPTSDNETLGAWLVLSDAYYHSLPTLATSVQEHVAPALKQYPTILFFHGNAATRAFHVRVRHYQALSARLKANVLAIDYRGFGDSTGKPSEDGLVRDARAAWDWLAQQGVKGEEVLVVGHSLGTGVSAGLGAELASEGIKCRGIVLLSPFSSIRELLNTYHIFGVLPLMKPIALIPSATSFVSQALIHKFDTMSRVPSITADVLIAHAEDDWDIPYTHSEVLFNAFLEPYLPPVDHPKNPLLVSKEEWTAITEQQMMRKAKLQELVTKSEIQNFGKMRKFTAKGRKVVHLQTLVGGHDYLGVQEGVQDVIAREFGYV